MKRIVFSVAVLALLGCPAFAQSPFGSTFAPDTARDAVREGRQIPLRDIARRIKAQVPGEMLDAELVSEDGRGVYHIKWITPDGRRIDFTVDASSGTILSQRGA